MPYRPSRLRCPSWPPGEAIINGAWWMGGIEPLRSNGLVSRLPLPVSLLLPTSWGLPSPAIRTLAAGNTIIEHSSYDFNPPACRPLYRFALYRFTASHPLPRPAARCSPLPPIALPIMRQRCQRGACGAAGGGVTWGRRGANALDTLWLAVVVVWGGPRVMGGTQIIGQHLRQNDSPFASGRVLPGGEGQDGQL